MSLGAEDQIHQWLRRRLRKSGHHSVGDDGAILPAGGPWAVTQDHQIEGVHFPARLDPGLIARRLLAVNLSDLAAMGAEPAYAFLALSCPASFDVRSLLSRFIDACGSFGVELAGGDLSNNDKVTASLTLMGRRSEGGQWLLRSNGRSGDRLWIAGDLGLSAAGRRLVDRGAMLEGRRIRIPASLGLTSQETRTARRAIRRHFAPEPQLAVGRWLASRRRAAAIDVSDGLAIDLHRLCRESGTGARINGESLSNQRGFGSLCRKLELPPMAMILAGGEDYALLFALPPRALPPADLQCRPIGSLRPGPDLYLISRGRTEPLAAKGWDHFENPPEAD